MKRMMGILQNILLQSERRLLIKFFILTLILLIAECDTYKSKTYYLEVKIPKSISIEELHAGINEEIVESFYNFLKKLTSFPSARWIIDQLYDSFNRALLQRTAFSEKKKQNPLLYNLVYNVCTVLHIDKRIDVYIINDNDMNAFVMNMENPILVLTSSLLQYMPNDELIFVIGHELGHIKCKQILIQTLLLGLINKSGRIIRTLGAMGFHKHIRTSDEIADRAGLISCQNISIAERALLRLLTGNKNPTFYKDLDVDEYLRQYESNISNETWLTKFRILENVLKSSHPFVPERIKSLRIYYKSDNYSSILGESNRKIKYKLKIT